MNVLIAGSSGFIGSALVKEFSKSYNVYTVARSPSDLPNHFQVDIRSEDLSRKLPTDIDCVVHLVQAEQYGKDASNNDNLFETNVKGTFRLLEWSRLSGVKRVILASSGNVYAWGGMPLNEDSVRNPDSFYGASKLAMEVLAKQYSEFFDVVALRLFTVYGPGQKTMLIPGLLNKLRLGVEILIQGGSGPRFSPLFIEDCVQFFCNAVSYKMPEKFCAMNISGSEILSVKDIVDVLADAHNLLPIFKEPGGTPPCYASNSQLSSRILGYTPKFSFKEGVKIIAVS